MAGTCADQIKTGNCTYSLVSTALRHHTIFSCHFLTLTHLTVALNVLTLGTVEPIGIISNTRPFIVYDSRRWDLVGCNILKPCNWKTTLQPVRSLADCTARSMIGYWHDNVCLSVSVHLSVCDTVHWGWMIHPTEKVSKLQKKCLNKWIGSAPLAMQFYNFQPLTPTRSHQAPTFLRDRCCCRLAIHIYYLLKGK